VVLHYASSMKDNTHFMACSLTPVAGTSSQATGMVACLFGPTAFNNSIFCQVQYEGLSSNVFATDVQMNTGSTTAVSLGQVLTFQYAVNHIEPGLNSPDGSFDAVILETSVYVPSSGSTPAIPAQIWPTNAFNTSMGDFSQVLFGCFNNVYDCVVTIYTVNHPMGELQCEFSNLIFGAAFDVPLVANTTLLAESEAHGFAWLDWMVTESANTYAATSVWLYAVDYAEVSGPVNFGGIFNSVGLSPSVAVVAFDTAGPQVYNQRQGNFVGVSIQGSMGTGMGPAFSGGYDISSFNNMNFLVNCSRDYCYVGVRTTVLAVNDPNYMELHGKIIAGVGQLWPSMMVLMVLFSLVITRL